MNGDRVIRAGLVVSLGVVTLIAIGVSYKHLYDLADSKGESGATAVVLPVTVDGLILATSLVIVNAARHRSRPPVLAWLMLLAGIGATLAGNVAHGIEHGWAGSVVAGWPAVVAAGCFHLVIGEIKRGRGAESDVKDDMAFSDLDEPWSDDRPVGIELWDDLATAPPAPADPVATGTALDRWFDGTEPTTVADLRQSESTEREAVTTDPEVAAAVATARERFADDLAAGRVPSIRAIRRQCKVGYPRAVQVHEALSGT
ncbi:uncharacterized protein DUF2637 [Actinomadura pelletieri DSM 43383]|uniref:Uncharacterized protein DUF2637 n=1 Tax=Actinomadura pelletieri DSM 43383 TaxID=1120940 RepID=A0A495QSV4_9ACTN|nr:DUF2637 domain-containing protein [Actinomadura pelletieri]RKS76491.1 uncharacterized protein DUF2637 [Actinomadura pelletieri DSM 43383]